MKKTGASVARRGQSLNRPPITEPGVGVFSFNHLDGNLTLITEPNGNERGLTYDGDGRLTGQTWGPLNMGAQ